MKNILKLTPLSKTRSELAIPDLAKNYNPQILAIKGKDATPVLVVLAAIHGDEYEGVLAIQDLYEKLEPDTLKGTLLMVPVCNPLAFESYTRSTPKDGKNLARVFPGNASGTVTERIAFELGKIIKQADFLIDLHSAGTTLTSPTLVGYYRNSGQVGEKVAAAARAFSAPVIWEHPSIAAGRTLSLAAECGIPALYTEAKGGLRVDKNDLRIFTEGVLNVMGYLGMLERPPSDSKPLILGGGGNTDTMLSFQNSGLFRSAVEVLQKVKQNDLIGIVRDLDGTILEEIQAPQSGYIVFLRAVPFVKQGDLAVLIAKRLA